MIETVGVRANAPAGFDPGLGTHFGASIPRPIGDCGAQDNFADHIEIDRTGARWYDRAIPLDFGVVPGFGIGVDAFDASGRTAEILCRLRQADAGVFTPPCIAAGEHRWDMSCPDWR